MKLLVINGPNLNVLESRDKDIYGNLSLEEINNRLVAEGKNLGVDLFFFQSNSEGDMIDFIQKNASDADGIIINPGALTHYGYSLRDALIDIKLPIIEVHLSNIYAREEWRAKSVVSPVITGQVTGLGWRGYLAALRLIVDEIRGDIWK